MKTLTEQDFIDAAATLKCEVAAIKAVAKVESRGAGFYSNGFPVILFERHKFHKFTNGKYDTSHAEISNAKSGGYGPGGANQIRKFDQAFALDPDAAMESCSWGKFQVMGFNYKICGYENVGAFVNAMKESEGKHLQAFVAYVIYTKLASALRNKKWAVFAEGYNGEDYAKNHYDTNMATAYKTFKNSTAEQPLIALPADNVTETSKTSTSSSGQPSNTLGGEEQGSGGENAGGEQETPNSAPIETSAVVNADSGDQAKIDAAAALPTVTVEQTAPQNFWTKFWAILGGIFTGAYTIPKLDLSDGQLQLIKLIIPYLIIAGIVALCWYFFIKNHFGFKREQMIAQINTDPTRGNIKFVEIPKKPMIQSLKSFAFSFMAVAILVIWGRL